ncbi:hypothetical protein MKEN_00306000 [Mycena kentingensis (nom. inval.)]|nr:hypothetical protein MKEN_00306000 [Mycena kentingensis (nom. inval.)]
METPRFWADLEIDARLLADCMDTAESLLDSVLRRSEPYPISLKVATDDIGARRLLLLLVQASQRWRALGLSTCDMYSIQTFRNAKGKTPMLQNLTLHLYGSRTRDLLPGDALFNTPRLCKVVFNGEQHNLPRLPWNQLQSCYMTIKSPLDLRKLPLKHLPSNAFSSLSLDYQGYPPQRVAELDPAVWKLRALRLFTSDSAHSGVRGAAVAEIWNSVTFTNSEASFSCMVTRSGLATTLRQFSVIARIPDTELVSALREIPRFEFLRVVDLRDEPRPVVTDLLLSELAATDADGNPILVPRLAQLDIASALAFTDESLEEMLDKRLQLDRCFKLYLKIEKDHQREVGGALKKRLAEWQARNVLQASISDCAKSQWHKDYGVQ